MMKKIDILFDPQKGFLLKYEGNKHSIYFIFRMFNLTTNIVEKDGLKYGTSFHDKLFFFCLSLLSGLSRSFHRSVFSKLNCGQPELFSFVAMPLSAVLFISQNCL